MKNNQKKVSELYESIYDSTTGQRRMISAPHASDQGTVCSGWKDGNSHCKHGHIQTFNCNPYVDPRTKRWTTDLKNPEIPVCLIE
jgi:hypothetical protein